MFQNIGPVGLLLIVVVALLLFGPKKLPELGRAFGRTLRAFKEGTKEMIKDEPIATESTKPPHEHVAETPTTRESVRLPD